MRKLPNDLENPIDNIMYKMIETKYDRLPSGKREACPDHHI